MICTCGLVAHKCDQKRTDLLARRYAAVQQKAKLLNGRAIRPHRATRHAIALVKRDLDHTTIRPRIAADLGTLLLLRLED